MRITNTMLVNNMSNYVSDNLNRMQKYQYQLATGKKIQVPSDDPIVAARALKLRTDVSQVEQYQKNVKDAKSWLDVSETGLSNMEDILLRAKELAVQGGNGTYSQADMDSMAAEVGQLKSQLVNIANSSIAGRNIFTGYQTDKKLMNDDGTFAIDVNNNETINYEVGTEDRISINVTGGDLFNAGGAAVTGSKGKLIQDFDDFITALNTGNTPGIAAVAANLDTDQNNVLRLEADVGARQNRLDLTDNRLANDSTNFTKLMSDNEDVDMAETIMNFTNEQNVYNASLSAGAKIIQTSLIDFLK